MSSMQQRDPILYIDCTATFRSGLNTGVQRVVRAVIAESAVFEEKLGIECISICFQFNNFYRLEDAKRVSLDNQGEFSPISFCYRDLYLCPDAFWTMGMDAWYDYLVDRGVTIATFIYDLIPLTHPDFFFQNEGVEFESALRKVVRKSHMLFCISGATLRDLRAFCIKQSISLPDEKCRVIPLAPALRPEFQPERETANCLPAPPFFLMVGTVEPRRAYVETIEEFLHYRKSGGNASLLVVGKAGNAAESILRRFRETAPHVVWLDNVTDEELMQAYRRALAVVCSSRVEGYGMSVSEGLAYTGLVLANRLPVFGEFAGAWPYYFEIDRTGDLSRLMAMASTLRRLDLSPDLGNWERTVRVIADGLADISLCHGLHRAIEVGRNSAEAVRWCHWLHFGSRCDAKDIPYWLNFPTVRSMFESMRYLSLRGEAPLSVDAVRWAQAVLNERTEVSTEEAERWQGICANLSELRAHLLYEQRQLHNKPVPDAVRWFQSAINGRNDVGDEEVDYWLKRCDSLGALREMLLREQCLPEAP